MSPQTISVAAFVFWACTALVAYTYIGYPIVIGLLARLSRCAQEAAGRRRGGPSCGLAPDRGIQRRGSHRRDDPR